MNPDETPLRIAGAEWQLVFSKAVVALLHAKAQRRWYQRESVGQLFSRNLAASPIIIGHATLLQPKRSSWASVQIDIERAEIERKALLDEGWHCLGLWHTHPEPHPAPSRADTALAEDHVAAAKLVLNGLIFVIVGNKPFPDGWYVSAHDGAKFHRALPD